MSARADLRPEHCAHLRQFGLEQAVARLYRSNCQFMPAMLDGKSGSQIQQASLVFDDVRLKTVGFLLCAYAPCLVKM